MDVELREILTTPFYILFAKYKKTTSISTYHHDRSKNLLIMDINNIVKQHENYDFNITSSEKDNIINLVESLEEDNIKLVKQILIAKLKVKFNKEKNVQF